MKLKLHNLHKYYPLLTGILVTVLMLWVYTGAYLRNNQLLKPVKSFYEVLNNFIEESMFSIRGEIKPTGKVVVVAVDEKSLKDPDLGQWPWPRNKIARLLQNIYKAEPKVVGLDIVFAEPDQTSPKAVLQELKPFIVKPLPLDKLEELDHDNILGETVANYKTILGYFFTFNNVADEKTDFSSLPFPSCSIRVFPAGRDMAELDFPLASGAVRNVPAIGDMAESEGFMNISLLSGQGTLRRMPLFFKMNINGIVTVFPSLGLEMLRTGISESEYLITSFPGKNNNIHSVRLGSYTIPVDENGFLYVNYRGAENTLPVYSAADIYNDRIGKKELQGKYILIGATAAGLHDIKVTPFSQALPGPEVQATVIDNILAGDVLHRLSQEEAGINLALVFTAGILFSIILTKFSSIKGAVAGFSFLVLLVLINYYFFFLNHKLLGIAFPITALIAVLFFVSLANYVFEERQKKYIRSAFQCYLSPHVMEEMLKDPEKLKLGGERRELSIFFSDLQGFSSISEKMQADELTHLLNEYLNEMTHIILETDGTLDKYEGDAIICFWNAPLDQSDHALRAVRAGICCHRKLIEKRPYFKEKSGHDLYMRIGIHSGDVLVGNMGSDERFDYTVIGDTANLASRLEGANKAFGSYFMVSEQTWEKLEDKVWGRELGLIRVVGRNTPVRVFEPMGFVGEEKPSWLEKFAEGVQKCRIQKWEEAYKLFTSLPEDAASMVYAERCKKIIDKKDSDWDGIFNLTEK